MAKKVQFTLSGKAVKDGGEITGNGCLKFETDAASMSLKLDYKSRNKVVLTLSGTQGVKVSSSTRIKFSENISKDLFNKDWEGKFAIKLEISQSIAAQLTQEISKDGPRTTAEITVKF